MANPRAQKANFSEDQSWYDGLANFFRGGIRTNEQAAATGGARLSPDVYIDPNSVNPYAGAEPYQAIRPGAVTATPSDIAAMGAMRNGEALVDSQIGLRRGATLPNGALLNPYEGVYNPVVKAPDAVAPAPKAKTKAKPKPKRKAKRTTQAKAPVVAPVIQEVRASDPKPSHAQRLAMLDPHYANDDEYGYTY